MSVLRVVVTVVVGVALLVLLTGLGHMLPWHRPKPGDLGPESPAHESGPGEVTLGPAPDGRADGALLAPLACRDCPVETDGKGVTVSLGGRDEPDDDRERDVKESKGAKEGKGEKRGKDKDRKGNGR